MYYKAVLIAHVTVILLYLILLLVRLFFLFINRREDMLLFGQRSAGVSAFLLIIAVLSGLYLSFYYDFSEALWFSVKLIFLAAIILTANRAFKRFSRIAGMITLIFYIFVIVLSYVKVPPALPH
jgi:uncharacterized membrane protein SirB2